VCVRVSGCMRVSVARGGCDVLDATAMCPQLPPLVALVGVTGGNDWQLDAVIPQQVRQRAIDLSSNSSTSCWGGEGRAAVSLVGAETRHRGLEAVSLL